MLLKESPKTMIAINLFRKLIKINRQNKKNDIAVPLKYKLKGKPFASAKQGIFHN